MAATVYVAMGGNLGPVAETFQRAIDELDADSQIRVRRMSRLFRTLAVGPDAGPSFLNAAMELETDRSPLDLLDALQSVEVRLGRVREGHWRPRTLDLDLILYGDQVIKEPRLRVPHPACWYRRFVLDPLCEIAGQVEHPTKRCTLRRLRDRLLQRPFRCTLVGPRDAASIAQLQQDFPDVVFDWCDPDCVSGEQGATLLIGLVPLAASRMGAGAKKSAPLDHAGWLDLSGDSATLSTSVRSVLEAALGEPMLQE